MQEGSVGANIKGSILATVTVSIVLIVFSFGSLIVLGISSEQGTNSDDSYSLLDGAIDLHLHIDPDSDTRAFDAIEIPEMQLAQKRGLRGFVAKNHFETSGSVAYLLRKVIPGIEVFGGIALNHNQGGINLSAVEYMAKEIKGQPFRFVWMPTMDSEHMVRGSDEPDRPSVKVSQGCDAQGCIDAELLPEVNMMVGLIAEHDLILATGHLSSEESLLVLREANKQGVEHMIVTHPMISFIKMNEAQMQEAASLGAFLEFDFRNVLTEPGELEMIRKLGPEHVIIDEFWTESESGRREYADPDGLALWVKAMNDQGFSNRELDMMVKENPAKLLGLPLLPRN